LITEMKKAFIGYKRPFAYKTCKKKSTFYRLFLRELLTEDQ